MLPAIIIIVAYLLGSIPFGYLIVKLSGGGDVRAVGSGGMGATNVTRRAGKGAGVLTLVLDALKGVAAVALARWLLAPGFGVNWWVAAAALAAIVGHIFPVWLRFRGGKGVATGLGVFVGLSPLAVACVLLVFVAVVWYTRYVSLGSMTAAAALPLFILLLDTLRGTGEPQHTLERLTVALVGGALIVFMHRANLDRLRSGTESKLKW